MSQLLAGKSALVLGVANRWSIAYSIAQAYRREGAKLILTYQGDRQKQTVEELAQELGADTVLNCDVTQPAQVESLVAALQQQGPLHHATHSIAFASRDALTNPFIETTADDFKQALEVSAYSLVTVAKATAPLMDAGGSITTLTYLGGVRVLPGYNVMGVAKAALENSVRYLAHNLGPQNVRVNAISAGPIKTASARAIPGLSKMLEAVAKAAPLQRNTDPAEVADTAVFLASDLGRGVTGNVIYVDAGYQIMGLQAE